MDSRPARADTAGMSGPTTSGDFADHDYSHLPAPATGVVAHEGVDDLPYGGPGGGTDAGDD